MNRSRSDCSRREDGNEGAAKPSALGPIDRGAKDDPDAKCGNKRPNIKGVDKWAYQNNMNASEARDGPMVPLLAQETDRNLGRG